MTRDQRFWRLLTLLEDYYTTGERTAAEPPAVRFSTSGAGAVGSGSAGAVPGAAPAGSSHPVRGVFRGSEAAAASASESAAASAAAARGATGTIDPTSAAAPLPASALVAGATPPLAAGPPGGAATQEDSLAGVAREVAQCRACGLCAGRTRTVPGEGVARPRLLVIGEGPGRDEDRSGRPFVGPAGQYLDRWLAAINLDRRENCFITNVVKCRPPNNRDPLPEESTACQPFLQRQIRLLCPQALLTVGRIASQVLTGRAIALGALRGHVYQYQVPGLPDALPLVTTYHPSGVLRNPSLRAAVWDDLRMVARILAEAGE